MNSAAIVLMGARLVVVLQEEGNPKSFEGVLCAVCGFPIVLLPGKQVGQGCCMEVPWRLSEFQVLSFFTCVT